MTDVDALVAFIEARLGERERWAEAAGGDGSDEWGIERGWMGSIRVTDPGGLPMLPELGDIPERVEHIAAHDPQWALDDAVGVRRLIKRYRNALAVHESVISFTRGQDDGYRQACRDALLDVAWRYRRHPDWRQEWAPEGAGTDDPRIGRILGNLAEEDFDRAGRAMAANALAEDRREHQRRRDKGLHLEVVEIDGDPVVVERPNAEGADTDG